MKHLLAIILLLTLAGCALERYTMEQYWSGDEQTTGVLVVQWPMGIDPDDIYTLAATDPVTSNTRTVSAAPWTAPVEP